MKAGSSHFDLDGMGSIIAIPDSRNVPLFLCHVRFNPRTVGDLSIWTTSPRLPVGLEIACEAAGPTTRVYLDSQNLFFESII